MRPDEGEAPIPKRQGSHDHDNSLLLMPKDWRWIVCFLHRHKFSGIMVKIGQFANNPEASSKNWSQFVNNPGGCGLGFRKHAFTDMPKSQCRAAQQHRTAGFLLPLPLVVTGLLQNLVISVMKRA